MSWCRRGTVFQLPQPPVATQRPQAQIQQDLSCSFCVKGFLTFKKLFEQPGSEKLEPEILSKMLCSSVPEQYKGN